MKRLSILVLIFMAFLLSGCVTKNQYNALHVKDITTVQAGKKPVKLGIAFGGGGVRGFMHLGVIKALEEVGIKADLVTGSSAGSLAASLYASGKSYEEIERIVLELDEWDVADFTLFANGGLIPGQALSQWLNEQIDHHPIEALSIPLGIAVTDLTYGKSLLITQGDVGHGVQTSSTIPGAFVPVKSGKTLYVDGGILSIVPVRFAKAMGAEVVIGIDIYCGQPPRLKESMGGIAYATFRLQSCALAKEEMHEADILIQPNFEPKNFGSFSNKQESIQAGYNAAKKALPLIQKSLHVKKL